MLRTADPTATTRGAAIACEWPLDPGEEHYAGKTCTKKDPGSTEDDLSSRKSGQGWASSSQGRGAGQEGGTIDLGANLEGICC